MINRYLSFERRGESAMIEIIVIMVFSVLLFVGAIYLKYSMQSVDGILVQAHRIKARNLAYAAYQKALLTLKHQYAAGKTSWLYPEQKVAPADQMERSLGGGNYKLLKVEIVRDLKTPYETINRTFHNAQYVIGDAEYGKYDVYRITTMGEVPASKTRVKLTSLVKVIREKVRY
jgi:hypothetical protein